MRTPVRPGTLAHVRGGVGLVSEVYRHPTGPLCYRIVRGVGTTQYWDYEVEPVVKNTIREEIEKIGHSIEGFRKGLAPNQRDSLRQFREGDWDDLDAREVGNADDIGLAHANASWAIKYLRDTAAYLVQQGVKEMEDRLNFGISQIVIGGEMLASALLVHLRGNPLNINATLLILRPSLEALGTASALLFGTDDHVRAWLSNDTISAEKDGLPLLRSALRTKRPDVADPVVVYKWLSKYVHFTREGLMTNHASSPRPLRHSDAYASLAYVSWACAVIAEVALGYGDIAEWPERWPSPLPWE